MKAKELSIKDFTYELPDDRIAIYPVEKRDQSKLLIYKEGTIQETVFETLPDHLSSGDVLVFNDTKVIRARMLFPQPSGKPIEIFCLEPLDFSDPALAFQQEGKSRWKVLIGLAKKWKHGVYQSARFQLADSTIDVKAWIEDQKKDYYIVRFEWNTSCPFSEVIEHIGKTPLPPYINRDTEPDDVERYQTVYATFDGSVAAPTAGLHFTPQVLYNLNRKKIQTLRLTLHVGAGTFKPVKAEKMLDHYMHEERFYIELETLKKIQSAKENKSRIVAIGTTSLRTLESVYWHGASLMAGKTASEVQVMQWTPYEQLQNPSVGDSLQAVIDHLGKKNLHTLSGTTKLLIAPGYSFQVVDALITNFHQPNSTLLLLVAAFIGEDWKKVYAYALENNFRFLSYGDSSLLFRKAL